jgi:hypothetical protein
VTYEWSDRQKADMQPGTPLVLLPVEGCSAHELVMFVASIGDSNHPVKVATAEGSTCMGYAWNQLKPWTGPSAKPLDEQEKELLDRRSAENGKLRSDIREAERLKKSTLEANGALVREVLDLREEVAELTRELTNAREPIELRAEVERLNETIRLDGNQLRDQSSLVTELVAENVALRAEVLAHEDRQAHWRNACGALLDDFSDILTPPSEVDDAEPAVEKGGST